jgi:hypothetical protein
LSCRAPGAKLDALIEPWPAGRTIHILHDTAFAPESFNPGVDKAGKPHKPTRFAPIRDARGRVVPYLYGGSTLECAIFETVFHNVPIDAPDKSVDLDDYAQRAHGLIEPARELRLVDLTTDGLHRLKVPKAELIAGNPIDYPETARWAQALHQQYPEIDGLRWMSRQRDADQAIVLFGDRIATAAKGGALRGTRLSGPLRTDDTLRQAVLALALRVGIDAG